MAQCKVCSECSCKFSCFLKVTIYYSNTPHPQPPPTPYLNRLQFTGISIARWVARWISLFETAFANTECGFRKARRSCWNLCWKALAFLHVSRFTNKTCIKANISNHYALLDSRYLPIVICAERNIKRPFNDCLAAPVPEYRRTPLERPFHWP